MPQHTYNRTKAKFFGSNIKAKGTIQIESITWH